MKICVIETVLICIILIICRRKEQPKWQKNMYKILLLTSLIGIAGELYQGHAGDILNGSELLRNEPGTGAVTKELELTIPELGESEKIQIDIAEQKLEEQDVRELFLNAKTDAEREFLGENESLDCIREKVVLPSRLGDGLIHADWQFDNYDIMNPDGTIVEEKTTADGTVVKATVTLTYLEEEVIHDFYFRVYPCEMTEKEQLQNKIRIAMEQEDEKSAVSKYQKLPKAVDGYELVWEISRESIGIKMFFLGIIAAVAVWMGAKKEEQRERDMRNKNLLLQYPEIVSKITLLIGAGMTLSRAWEKIVVMYEQQQKDQKGKIVEAYEEMRITYYEMKDGVGEIRAYSRFGERCGLQSYRKLASLITQNLRKGQSGLIQILENEVEEAFEVRKNMAKKYGEEAGTKLLLPMMIMMAIVMIIVLVPALQSFQI